MPRPREPLRRRRRRGRFRGLYLLLSVFLICAALVGGSIVFFRVRTVEVSGSARYTAEEIRAACGVEDGENLFLINKFAVVRAMFRRLPYLDTIVIRRRLPDALVVTVTDSVPAAVLVTAEGDWLVDRHVKLLEQAGGDCTRVTGLAPLSPTAGERAALGEAQAAESAALGTLLPLLDELGLAADTDGLDFTEPGLIRMTYAGRLTVELETGSDLGYKLRFFTEILKSLLPTDTGTVDMTGNEAYFTPA